jgi:hypothetical protein
MNNETRLAMYKIADKLRNNGHYKAAEIVETEIHNSYFGSIPYLKPCYVCGTHTRYYSKRTGKPMCGSCG